MEFKKFILIFILAIVGTSIVGGVAGAFFDLDEFIYNKQSRVTGGLFDSDPVYVQGSLFTFDLNKYELLKENKTSMTLMDGYGIVYEVKIIDNKSMSPEKLRDELVSNFNNGEAQISSDNLSVIIEISYYNPNNKVDSHINEYHVLYRDTDNKLYCVSFFEFENKTWRIDGMDSTGKVLVDNYSIIHDIGRSNLNSKR